MAAASFIFPHQLFKKHPAIKDGQAVYLIEEALFFNQYNFHQKKILLHRASMQYYGVYKARDYYQKAYELATDKEFKAACLFMVAKCAQRQIPRPAYNYSNYDLADKKQADWFKKFKNNLLFSKFKAEFGTTKFYQYAYNRCSYLRDYVKKGTAPVKPTAKPKGKG